MADDDDFLANLDEAYEGRAAHDAQKLTAAQAAKEAEQRAVQVFNAAWENLRTNVITPVLRKVEAHLQERGRFGQFIDAGSSGMQLTIQYHTEGGSRPGNRGPCVAALIMKPDGREKKVKITHNSSTSGERNIGAFAPDVIDEEFVQKKVESFIRSMVAPQE